MKKMKFIVSFWALLAIVPLFAQPSITLQLPDTVANSGDTLLLDITARQFNQIVSVQFSINFDPDVIRYVSFEQTNLPFIAIGNNDAANGNLRVSWFDIQGAGVTIPNGSSIIRLKFFANGDAGDVSNVNISGTPLAIQVFQATGEPNKFEDVTVNQLNGLVAIAGGFGVIFNVKDVSCINGENGAITATVVGASNNTGISWTGPDNFQSQNEDISGLRAGAYTFEIRDENGSLLLDSTLVVGQPTAALEIDTLIVNNASCSVPSGSAVVNVSGGTAPYRYNIGRGFTNSNQFNNLAPDNYSLVVRDTNDCQATANFIIEANDAPELNLPDTLSFCEGENLMLDAGMFNSYLWSTGATTRSISVNQPGAYSVTVGDAPECVASDTIQVVSGAMLQVSISATDTTICPGKLTQLIAAGGDTYQWIDPTGTLSATNTSSPFARPLEPTTYTVRVSNGCGTAEASIRIDFYEITSSAMPDTSINLGETLQLRATGGVEYFWFLSEYTVSDNSIPNPTTMPEDSTSYFVRITDANGCEKFDTINVAVIIPLDILAVNLITPNGDGKNDTLFFGDISEYGFNELKVYNRWGDLLYQKQNYQSDNERFDGTYKGKLLPTGTYFYVLSFGNGEIKQTLTILRE